MIFFFSFLVFFGGFFLWFWRGGGAGVCVGRWLLMVVHVEG